MPPPPGSPPVARAEAQNRTELNGPEGLTARGQVKGSPPGGKGLVHRRSRRCRQGLAGAGSCMPGSPREPQAVTYGDSRAGGHLPLSTPLDHGTLVFKSKERSPLPTGHTSACEASPAGSSQLQGLPSTLQYACCSNYRKPLTALLCSAGEKGPGASGHQLRAAPCGTLSAHLTGTNP